MFFSRAQSRLHPMPLRRFAPLAVPFWSLALASASLGQGFGPAEAEHLWNRAGFGARPADLERAVAQGREATVEELLRGGVPRGEFFAEALNEPLGRMERVAMMEGERDEEAKKEALRERRRRDGEQLADFTAYWLERMTSGEDPLREKLTLFWHGHFATSQETVKNSYHMIRQNETFYELGLGRFGALLAACVQDPALLIYLDNDQSKKGQPNENLARELFELFTLGTGAYGERDVQEAARALTGWSVAGGEFRRVSRYHDEGEKRILGATGPWDGDDLVELILAQEALGPFLAGELLAWYEGVEPTPERRADYGRFFAKQDYDVAALLRRLFNDPEFYRPEVLGSRIASPVEELVGLSVRLEVRPPARLLAACAAALGERLFFPPSVKGWDGGEAWISTASLMLRANLAGVLLGVVKVEEVLGGEPLPAPEDAAMASEELEEAPERDLGDFQALKNAARIPWRPRYSLAARFAGHADDAELVQALASELLAVELSAQAAEHLVAELSALRAAGRWTALDPAADPQAAEPVLRRLAHVLLSLPEARLN
jgi:hypothetical protein